MTDRDYGYEAQRAAEDRLRALDNELMDPDPNLRGPETSGYDGCLTCMVRETLEVAWPIIEEYVRNNPESDGPR